MQMLEFQDKSLKKGSGPNNHIARLWKGLRKEALDKVKALKTDHICSKETQSEVRFKFKLWTENNNLVEEV